MRSHRHQIRLVFANSPLDFEIDLTDCNFAIYGSAGDLHFRRQLFDLPFGFRSHRCTGAGDHRGKGVCARHDWCHYIKQPELCIMLSGKVARIFECA